MLGQLPSSNSVRVRHFLPGLGIALSAGGSAILSADGSAQWLSVPFGVGTAMVAHELRLLAGRNNPYWRGERFAFAQGCGGDGRVAGARRPHDQPRPLNRHQPQPGVVGTPRSRLVRSAWLCNRR